MPYIDRIQFLIDEQEAFVSAQAQIDDPITKNINEVIHKKVRQLVMDAPSVELTRVSHGYWSRSDKKGYYCRGYLCCSVCGKENRHMEGEQVKKYCAHCGSIMDEKIHDAIDGVQQTKRFFPENENGMKPCPFCGGEAEMNLTVGKLHYTSEKKDIPKGAIWRKDSYDQNGFWFKIPEYIPMCCDTNCAGRFTKGFIMYDDAITAWNMRR